MWPHPGAHHRPRADRQARVRGRGQAGQRQRPRVPAEALLGPGEHGAEGQEVRDGGQHQDGADEADPGAPAAADQVPAAAAGHLHDEQDLRGLHQLRRQGGFHQASISTIRAHSLHLDELGLHDREAQGLRIRGVRAARGGAAGAGADERDPGV